MHSSGLLGGVAAEVDEGVGGVARLARLIPLCGFPPGGLTDTPLALAPASSMRVVHRVHCHPTRLSPHKPKVLKHCVDATAPKSNVPQRPQDKQQRKACIAW